MKKYLVCLLTVFNLLFLTSCQDKSAESSQSFNQSITQTIKSGPIKGKIDQKNQVIEWLGIPYAKAPIGKLRWKAPENVTKWTKTFDASKPGEKFIQFSDGKVSGSEKALNLDVVRPNSKETKLPVMVYLHGGNNQTGLAQEIKGNTFVKDINAIYVSINYRLGPLGFNPLEALKKGSDLENSGNYSLLDIAKSLDWVAENISVFGGDDKNITLAGFSAGGRDVMATLTSPLFKGKYQKAISFSGGMTLSDTASSQKIVAKAIASLVVEDGKKATLAEAEAWLLGKEKEVTTYLYALEAERLAPLMANAAIRMEVFPHLYKDGNLIPKKGFNIKKYNDVPLMLLTGSNEFSLFTAFDPYFAKDFGSGELFKNIEKKQEFDYVRHYGSQLYRLSNGVESARQLSDHYKSHIFVGEIYYGDNPEVTPELARGLGAFHGIFEPFLQKPSNYKAFIGKSFDNKGAKDLEKELKAYLKNFLKTGNPNSNADVKWSNWNNQNQAILKFDANKQKLLISKIKEQETAQDIIKKMEEDQSISADQKRELNTTVLNGRWFSAPLDQTSFSYQN